ncbi:MAG TPA: Gfo/Idh/MocA family oxidoreductase [Terracidiphilus sp.]|jgi:predicted dehydrogenase
MNAVRISLIASLNAALFIAVSTLYAAPQPSALQPAAADQQGLRVAIVGLEHGHVEGFLSSLGHHPEVQLVGIADPNQDLIAKYEKKFNLAESLFFKDEASMIEARHPDAVLVYTSIAQHRPAIDIAAQHGVSVMVEKPLAVSYADALHIQQVAERSHIRVLTNFETTWYASNRAAYDQLQKGQIGELRKLVVHDGHQGPKEINVPPEFLSWLTDPKENGAGALFDFGCYGVDLATWLMHGEMPQTVTAVLNHDKPQIYPKVDDDATVILQYPHTQVTIMASWTWPFGRKDMEVYGANGYVITVESNGLRVRHEHDSSEHTETAQALPAAERDSLSYLTAVLKRGLDPKQDLTSLETNVKVVRILDAAKESARTGQAVHLDR